MNGPDLLKAVERGDLAALRALLAGGAGVNERGRSGQTALMLAAAHGDMEAVRLLLRAGAEVNARRDDGMTPLLHAAFFGHASVVRALLDEGADVRARDWIGMTPLDWARAQGAMEVVEMLAAAVRQAARPAPVSPVARVDVRDGAAQVLSLPVPGTLIAVGVEAEDDVLDLTRARGPLTSTASARPPKSARPSPPPVARQARNGNGATRAGGGPPGEPSSHRGRRPSAREGEHPRLRAETPAVVGAQTDPRHFRRDAAETHSNGSQGAPDRPASECLEERGAATYGSVGGEYLKGAPTDSYMYVGFFLATVFGSALILLFLFLSL